MNDLPFAIRSATTSDGDGLLTVEGEVDLVTAPRLRDALVHALRTGEGNVTVDAAGVTFMDSQGVHALASALQLVRGTGRRITLRHPNAAVRRLIDLTRLPVDIDPERMPPGANGGSGPL